MFMFNMLMEVILMQLINIHIWGLNDLNKMYSILLQNTKTWVL